MEGIKSSREGQSTDVMQMVEGNDLVKGCCEHEYPPGPKSLQWYSWLVSCCSGGDWQVRSLVMLR